MAFLSSANERTAKYQKQWNDIEVIPDKHNCGCHGTLTPWYEVWSDATADTAGQFYVKNSHPRVNENLDFSKICLYFGNKSFSDEDWYFKNCNFNGWYNDGKSSSDGAIKVIDKCPATFTVHLENCTITGYVRSAIYNMGKVNVHMKNCLIECPKQDGAKGSDGIKTIIENCYIYGGGGYGWHEGEDVPHSDAIQWSSGRRVFIENVRCEWIPFNTESLKTFANACLYVDIEQGSILTTEECIMRNCLINGGGWTTYIITGDKADYRIKGVKLLNIRYGCNYGYGVKYTNTQTVTVDVNDYKAQDKVFVSSVWKENGVIHFLATNYTNQARTIIAVYGINDVETQATFTIAKCPTRAEQNADKVTYADWSSLPFDIEYTINADADYVVFYDTSVVEENQIRFADNLISPMHHLESITATKTITTYSVGDTLTTNDIVVTAHYSDGADEDVTSSATIDTTNVDMSTVGTYPIAISFTDDGITQTTSITITVETVSEYTILPSKIITGTEYVKTGIPEDTLYNYEVKVQMQSDNKPQGSGGHLLSSSNMYYPFLRYGNTGTQTILVKVWGNESDSGEGAPSFAWDTDYVLTGTINGANYTTNCSDILTEGMDTEIGSTKSTSKLALFAYGGTPATTKYRFRGIFYYMILKDTNNVEVHHFVPAVRNADSVEGILDTVTNTFYTYA